MADNEHTIRNAIIIGVVLALLVGGAAPWWLQYIIPPPGATPTPTTPISSASIEPTPASSPTVIPSPTPTGTPSAPITGCVLTITNPFVSLHAEPDIQSEEIGDVPPGQYETSATAQTEFGGQAQRWFEITASSRTGWVLYDTIQIASKSADCP
jgi:hypothetical protein